MKERLYIMKKQYEMYFRAGNEVLKHIGTQYTEDEQDIINQAIKTLESLAGYTDVEKQLLVKCGDKQVLNFTF